VQQRLALAELSAPAVKYVVWNGDMSAVALLSKHAIVIADKRLGNAQVWRGWVGERLVGRAASEQRPALPPHPPTHCLSCVSSRPPPSPHTTAHHSLNQPQTVHETIRVKSAAWDDAGVLLYSTLNHIKYCLPNGERVVLACNVVEEC
jgi:coatomer protein complex subunit alpha (xenin)